MATLPISNVVNVSITSTPSGLGEVNVNSLALFTTEAPSNSDVFRTYVSASQVEADFGTNAVTTAMANNIFAQTPNILSGNGRLVVIPMESAVSATAGDVVTTDISGNLANFQAVTDGSVSITLNGVARVLTGLNFSRALSLSDIAEVMQRKLPDAKFTATSTAITIESKKVGASSAVAIASDATGTDISGAGFLETASATESTGSDATGETIVDAIARVKDDVSFVGVITNLDIEDAVISTTASAIQAQDRIFVHHVASPEDLDGIVTTVRDASQDKTRLTLYTRGIADANLAKSAYAGRGFSVNTRGSRTAQTLELKPLANVLPDNGINQTIADKAKDTGADIYIQYDGDVSAIKTSGANDYFDNVYMDLALKFALETAGFNYLRQTNTKVPQTETGMNGLKSAYNQVCERFVNNGFIGRGLQWSSSEVFGNPEIFKENITNKGYYTYSAPIATQDPVERAERKAPLVQIGIKRAGAIHSSDVTVIVND